MLLQLVSNLQFRWVFGRSRACCKFQLPEVPGAGVAWSKCSEEGSVSSPALSFLFIVIAIQTATRRCPYWVDIAMLSSLTFVFFIEASPWILLRMQPHATCCRSSCLPHGANQVGQAARYYTLNFPLEDCALLRLHNVCIS
jgi:hypothetical protein